MSTSAPPADLGQVIERVRPALEADEHVRFAYLFGWTVRDDAHSRSDVDLAVYLHPPGTLTDEARLHECARRGAGARGRGPVTLNHAPLWLQYRILGEGAVVFTGDERGRIAFRARGREGSPRLPALLRRVPRGHPGSGRGAGCRAVVDRARVESTCRRIVAADLLASVEPVEVDEFDVVPAGRDAFCVRGEPGAGEHE